MPTVSRTAVKNWDLSPPCLRCAKIWIKQSTLVAGDGDAATKIVLVRHASRAMKFACSPCLRYSTARRFACSDSEGNLR